jgi:hypothetical protein
MQNKNPYIEICIEGKKIMILDPIKLGVISESGQ